MANGLVIADIPGAVNRGLQFRRQQQLAPLQQQQAEGALRNQQQQFETGGLQQQNIQSQIDQRTDEQKNISLVNTALKVGTLEDSEIAPFLTSQINFIRSQGGDPAESERALVLAESGDFAKVRKGAENLVNIGVRQGIIKPEAVQTPGAGQFTLGNKRFDAQGNVVAEGAAVPVKLSSVQQKVAAEGIDPNSEAGFARAKEITQGSRTDPSLKPSEQQVLSGASEGELASAGFANRVGAANKALTDLENIEGFDPTAISSAVLGNVPLGNIAQSTEQQQFLQAKRDWITAVLRKESGAAIGKDEFENEDKKFFPQIGDKPEVLERKRQGRERAFENLKKQSKGVFDVQFKEERDLTTLSDDDLLDF